MSKMPISWHKQNLINIMRSVEMAEIEANAAQNRFIKLRSDAGRLLAQIERAEAEGKDGFDQDKYKEIV